MKDYKKILEGIVNIINTTEKSDIGFANICSYIGENCPELKESEDEMIRKDVYNYLYNERHNIRQLTPYTDELDRWLAWLEKQKPINISIEDKRIRKSLINYVKAHGNGGDFTKEKYIAWLEKQGDTSEIVNKKKIASDILRGAAINLITWIDYNAAEGNMCLSNMECKDIEDALVSGDWDKIYAYIKKKLEKQGEQKHTELPKGEDYGIDGLWHAIRILEKTLGNVEGYQSDDGILEHKCAISAVKELYEKKPTVWSEEDERILEEVKFNFESNKEQMTPALMECYEKFFDKIKHLIPQNDKQELSEEDETTVDVLINLVKMPYGNYIDFSAKNRLLNWLIALKGRITQCRE